MKVLAIARASASRAAMEEISTAIVTLETGILGDRRGRGGKKLRRQVTILNMCQWVDTCSELGVELPWTTRRANLVVDGPKFGAHLLGKKLAFLGSGLILEVTGETVPCSRMDEAHHGLQQALKFDGRGGITCRVIHGGGIYIGQTLALQ